MGRSQREKGARGEREAAEFLRRWYPEVERNLTECREGQGVDLTGTPGVAVQVKRRARVTEAVAQAALCEASQSQPRLGRIPVALWRSDRHGWRVTVWAQDLGAFGLAYVPVTLDAAAFFDSIHTMEG